MASFLVSKRHVYNILNHCLRINLDKLKVHSKIYIYFFQGSNLVRTLQEMNKKTRRKTKQQKTTKVKKQRQHNNQRMKKG